MVMIRVEAIPDYVSCFIINNYSPPTQSILMNIYQDTVNIDQCSLSLRQIIVSIIFRIRGEYQKLYKIMD